jgi:hypothetical protein
MTEGIAALAILGNAATAKSLIDAADPGQDVIRRGHGGSIEAGGTGIMGCDASNRASA